MSVDWLTGRLLVDDAVSAVASTRPSVKCEAAGRRRRSTVRGAGGRGAPSLAAAMQPPARAHVARGDELGGVAGVAGRVAQAPRDPGGGLAAEAGERAAVVAVVVGERAAGAHRDEPRPGRRRRSPVRRAPPGTASNRWVAASSAAVRSAKKLAARASSSSASDLHRLGARHAADDGAELRPRLRHPALAVGERAALGERRVEPAVADLAEQRLQPRAGAQPRPAGGDPLRPARDPHRARRRRGAPRARGPARARPSTGPPSRPSATACTRRARRGCRRGRCPCARSR